MDLPMSTAILFPAAAVAAPLLALLVGRWVRVPLVVFEIVLGILIGPDVFGWVKVSEFSDVLASVGLVMLFFMAGNEIDFREIAGRPMRRAAAGWLISLGAGLLLGVALAEDTTAGVFVGIALASTAVGTILPILRDAGELHTPLGRAVTAVGAAGEFGPLLAISLFLGTRNPGTEVWFLAAFAVIAGAGIAVAARGDHLRVHRAIAVTMHTSGQFAMRLVVLLMAALAGLSEWLDIDMLLGAFAAGVLFRLLLADAEPAVVDDIESKLEAVAFGLLVPIFFINTGVTYDLDALLGDRKALILVPGFLVALLLVRGLPGTLAAPPGASSADRRSLALFSATALPIIVAVTDIGVEDRDLSSSTAAALVGAGMLSVLLFPLLALGQRRLPAVPSVAPSSLYLDEG